MDKPWQKEILPAGALASSSPKGFLPGFLRIVSITATVYKETTAASRAAALSFSSLLGIGPLVAIGILVAGLVLGDRDPQRAIHFLDKAVQFVAPQVNQYDSLVDGAQEHASNPKLTQVMEGFISGARSGSAGVLGVLSLIIVVLLLFTSIEEVFNEIWGVREGRGWVTRIVFYWTIVTLGAILLFGAMTLAGAGAFVNVFVGKLPFGPELLRLLRWSLPLLAFLLLVGVLAVFYRVIPNTKVFWRASFTGAVVVAVLLMLNNYLAFLYLRRVIFTKSLYGSLGIIPVLMFGLYIFWLFVLIGGQISYAVQNVHFRNSQVAWGTLSSSMRERLSLAVFLTICRRFHACLPPVSAPHLGTVVRVPAQILNECLNRLVDTRLIAPILPGPGSASQETVYQPAMPLTKLTLGEFKRISERLGEDPTGDALEQIDPVITQFAQASLQTTENEFFAKSVAELLDAHPFDDSRPPFEAIS